MVNYLGSRKTPKALDFLPLILSFFPAGFCRGIRIYQDKETGDNFLSKIGSVDPLGENGEFHTLVIDCPLYAKSFKVKCVERKTAKGMTYLNVSIG